MPKKYRVEITPAFEEDVERIYSVIAGDKPAVAAAWVNSLEQRVRKLANFPRRHEIIPETAHYYAEHRQLVFGNYRVIYRIEDDRVIVLRVVHSARLFSQSMLGDF